MSTRAIFPLADPVPTEVLAAARLTSARNVRAAWTGEIRPPKRGEWYISGAVPEAYRAASDYTRAYHIARLVEIRTTMEIVLWLDEAPGARTEAPSPQSPTKGGV